MVLSRAEIQRSYYQRNRDRLRKKSRELARIRRGTTSAERRRPADGESPKSDDDRYMIWRAMKSRCCDPASEAWADYGGRGIVVCERWLKSFDHFCADMGDRPSLGHSIDRIDNDGNYEPGNCRWATDAEQARNRRNSILLTHNGATKTLAAWADEMGVSYYTLYLRIFRKGLPVDVAMAKKITKSRGGPRSHLTEKDVRSIRSSYPVDSLVALAKRFGVGRNTIWSIATRRTWKHVE